MTKTDLRIAPGLHLPLSSVTQTFGVLAKRRAGKTYTAKVMAEEFAAAGIPFVVLDPMGAWWGLRASADGMKPGIPVVILGGAHGDVPLERTGGKLVADLVVDHPGFYVLDLEGFESNAAQVQFVTAFAERLYRIKATKRDPLHLFVDEADSFAPQRPGRDELHMLGAFESIVRRGGIRGLGTTLISQRAAVVNKNVLTQLDCLITLQTTSPQDQKTIREWVEKNAEPDRVKVMMDSLASLARGEAWVYNPEADLFKQVSIREGRTFNSSATPEVGTAVIEPKKMATVDLDAVRSAMAATVAKSEANDPALLRKRIAELERQVAAPVTTPEPIVEVQVERFPVVHPEDLEAMRLLTDRLTDLREDLANGYATLAHTLLERLADVPRDYVGWQELLAKGKPVQVQRTVTTSPAVKANGPMTRTVTVTGTLPGLDDGSEPDMRAGARKMLDTLARHYPVVLTRAQLGTLTGMSHTGGTFGNYISTMKRRGFVTEVGRVLSITPDGLAAAGVTPGNPMSADEVRETWRRSLRAGARSMFDLLVSVHPEALSREELGARTDITHTGGTFGNYLSTLRRNGLVEVNDGMVRATDVALGYIG